MAIHFKTLLALALLVPCVAILAPNVPGRLKPRAIALRPAPPVRFPLTKRQQRVDEGFDSEYWFHPRMHNWGNIGFGGMVHALCAPLATAIIDHTSYSGLNVRKTVHNNPAFFSPGDRVLDLCCGVGFSTAKGAVGIDTSPCMLRVARLRRPDATFHVGNAETYGAAKSFDVVSCMFATHEMPVAGRRRVLRNAMRVARRSVLVVDIDPNFGETLRQKPGQGATFLSGEPYVLEYLAEMDSDIASCAPVCIAAPGKGWKVSRINLVEKHVVVWHLERVG